MWRTAAAHLHDVRCRKLCNRGLHRRFHVAGSLHNRCHERPPDGREAAADGRAERCAEADDGRRDVAVAVVHRFLQHADQPAHRWVYAVPCKTPKLSPPSSRLKLGLCGCQSPLLRPLPINSNSLTLGS